MNHDIAIKSYSTFRLSTTAELRGSSYSDSSTLLPSQATSPASPETPQLYNQHPTSTLCSEKKHPLTFSFISS